MWWSEFTSQISQKALTKSRDFGQGSFRKPPHYRTQDEWFDSPTHDLIPTY